VMIAANAGSAYGVRKSVRSSPRPGNERCKRTAALVPNNQHSPTEITEYPMVTPSECSRLAPIGPWVSTATR